MSVTILPADTYKIISKSKVDIIDKKIVTMLYQPIIGYMAVSFYLSLLDDLDRFANNDEELQHYHLMSIMHLSLEDIVCAREKLEAVGLLKTYIKKDHVNSYIYQLFSPLPANEFLNHPILNVVLYNNIGKKEYNNIVNYFKTPRLVIKDYQDITRGFNEVFSSSVSYNIENTDILGKEYNNIILKDCIDFNLLVESVPKNLVSDRWLNDEVRELINNLAYIYRLDTLTMSSLIRDNINDRGLVDKTNLRKDARNYYQFENDGRLPTVIYKTQPEYLRSATGDTSKRAKLIYSFETTSPYDLLASKCKTGEPSNRDVRLIENLMIDMKLNPGVVNVLLAYVLHINNQKLSKNYIETIAGQWKRLNIETVEEALNLTDKEYKKNNKNKNTKEVVYINKEKKEEKLPEWFDKNIDGSIEAQEQQEMDDIIKAIIK